MQSSLNPVYGNRGAAAKNLTLMSIQLLRLAMMTAQFHVSRLSIARIKGMSIGTFVNFIGVVSSIDSPSPAVEATTQKRILMLKDMSGNDIRLVLWDNFCNVDGQTIQSILDSGEFLVLAVKSARVQEHEGKLIRTVETSQLLIKPECPEARELNDRFNSAGRKAPSVSMSRKDKKTLSQIKDELLRDSKKDVWIAVKATIWHIASEKFCYTACPTCIKKAVLNRARKWRCDKCNQTVDECDYRYTLKMQLADHTGMVWATAFQEAGEEIMDVSAKDLYLTVEEENDKFAETFLKVWFNEFNFQLQVQVNNYGDDQRALSYRITKSEKINFSSNTKALLQELGNTIRKEDPSSITLNRGLNPQTGTVGQQTALPASHVGQYGGPGGRMNSGMSSGGGNSGASVGALGAGVP